MRMKISGFVPKRAISARMSIIPGKIDENIGALMQQQTIFLEPDWDLDFGKPPQVELRLIQRTMTGLYALCIAHSAVRVGDTFRHMKWFQPQQVPNHHDGHLLAQIRLEVTSLVAFHNVLNRVSAGMNVGIEFSGDAEPLLEILEEEGWCNFQGQYHQWAENGQAMPKFLLVR